MRSSSVKSLVSIKSATAVTLLSLSLVIVAPSAHAAAARSQRGGQAIATKSENVATRAQRAMQRLFNRLLALALPSDPLPVPTPSANVDDGKALPSDPWPVVVP